MSLGNLHVESLRCIDEVSLALSPGLNLVFGPNGSGKTTVLESVHLLSTGKSFRSPRLRDVLKRGAPGFLVRGAVSPDEDSIPRCSLTNLGIQYTGGRTKLRIDGQDAPSIVAHARALPVVTITPDSQRLLTDGSALRRRLIDWSMFHVESSYQQLHGRYRRALQQRNALLRSGTSHDALESWTVELAHHGQALHDVRVQHISGLLDTLRDSVRETSRVAVDVAFTQGWNESQDLAAALRECRQHDLARGFTTVGPHRADLTFSVDGVPAQSVLSRGESKLFVVGVVLGQARDLMLRMQRTAVVLFDELASDLDARARGAVFDALNTLECQCLVTSVSADLTARAGAIPDASFELLEGGRLKV